MNTNTSGQPRMLMRRELMSQSYTTKVNQLWTGKAK